MKNLIKVGTVLALCTSLSFAATEAEMDEVKAHVEAGVEHCKAVGVAKCVEEFNEKESKWVKGDMYIFANDFDEARKIFLKIEPNAILILGMSYDLKKVKV